MKKVLSILSLILILLTLSACHGGGKKLSSFNVPENFDTSREFTITFWSKNDSNVTQLNTYKKAISDFEALYPNIHIVMSPYSDYSKIYADVITNISTNTTPNVCITYPDHVATYMSGDNIIVPLDDLISNDKYGLGGSEIKFDGPKQNEMISKFMEECDFDGYYYSIPFIRSTEALYVNVDMVHALGYELPEVVTWDYIFEVSEAAIANKKENETLIPFIYKSTDNMMIQMLKQKGGEYSNKYGEILMFNEDTRDILLEIYPHAKSKAFSTFKESSYPGNWLNKGECIFAIDSTAGATWMGTHAPQQDVKSGIVDFETKVMMIPQYDVENPQMISQGPSLCIFNKEDPQEVLASWLFTQYLLTNEVQISYTQTEGYCPVTKKALESSEYQDYLSRGGEDNDLYYQVKIDATKLLLDNIDNSFTTPVFNGSTSLRSAAGELIESVLSEALKDRNYEDRNGKEKITVTARYIEKTIYANDKKLYKLDSIEANYNMGESNRKQAFGELPTGSIVLLSTIAAVWVAIGAVFIITTIKNKNKK